MHAAFTPQEQEVIERLREKYGGMKDGQSIPAEEEAGSCAACSAPPRQVEPSSAPSRVTSNVEASVCAHCHGTGTLVEIYNHRRLENFCKHCDGRGVRVFKNGKEVVPGAATSGPVTSSTAVAPAGVVALHSGQAAGGGGSEDGDDASQRAAALRRDLNVLVAKTASYTKERMETLAILQQPHSGTADPAGREQAARDLLGQLDLQLERLELMRRKKQAALDRLTSHSVPGAAAPGATAPGAAAAAAASITIADIIANEGPRA